MGPARASRPRLALSENQRWLATRGETSSACRCHWRQFRGHLHRQQGDGGVALSGGATRAVYAEGQAAEQLKCVQELHEQGGPRPPRIFQAIGVYLGYALAHYAGMYDFRHLLVLGRVTSGAGGELIVQKANEVLRADFPDLAQKLSLHLPDEKSKRVGQAVPAGRPPKFRT